MSSLSEGIYEDGMMDGDKRGYLRGVDETKRKEAIRTAEMLIQRFPTLSDQEVSEIARDVSAEEVQQIRKGIRLK